MESVHKFLMLEHNRCIQCRRCVRGIKTADGERIFSFVNRGQDIELTLDVTKADQIDEKLAAQAADICPVGSIIFKQRGFSTPIGSRKFDSQNIGEHHE
jgi:[NiFe] hydrogenase diaphorase moiety small subunit